MKDGATLIAEERQRQVSQEGYNEEHDDQHIGQQLVHAAAAYLLRRPWMWPWQMRLWKGAAAPTDLDGRLRELAKAGALVAAEIDRVQRRKQRYENLCETVSQPVLIPNHHEEGDTK
jgi:hypothetical protein